MNEKLIKNNAFLEILLTTDDNIKSKTCWVNYLLRMYIRSGEKNNLETNIIYLKESDFDGIRKVVVHFIGDYAYGLFQKETGIHTRKEDVISVETANVIFSPEIDESIFYIDPMDLRIEAYTPSGCGGQQVCMMYNYVRITHIPTGAYSIVGNHRSQHKNKGMALKLLRSKLCYGASFTMRDYYYNKDSYDHPYRILDSLTGHPVKVINKNDSEKVLEGNLEVFMDKEILELKKGIKNEL